MKRKQANLYSLPNGLENPPYLSKEELQQFESQFVLFDTDIDLKKLKESFSNLNTSGNENYRPVELFVSTVLAKKQKCDFSQYIQSMNDFFAHQDEGELMMEMLSDNKKELSKNIVKQMLEQTLGREVSPKELSQILIKVFDVEDEEGVSKKKILNLLSSSKNK